MLACPKCSYPISEFDNVCPNCKYSLKDINKRKNASNNIQNVSGWANYNSRPSEFENTYYSKSKSQKFEVKKFNNFSDSDYDLLIVKKRKFPEYKTFFGLQNKNGKMILDIIYDAICPLESNGQRRFKLRGKTGIMNSNFDVIFKSNYLWITSADQDGNRRFVDNRNDVGILNSNFKIIKYFKHCKWIYSLEGNTRRIVFSKSKPFGSELLKMLGGTIVYAATLGLPGKIMNNKETNDILKKYKNSKTNNYDEAEEIYYNIWDKFEKLESYDSLIIASIKSLISSDQYPAFGLIDENYNFLINPKYQFISPLLEDNTRNCIYKKKFCVFDENKKILKEVD